MTDGTGALFNANPDSSMNAAGNLLKQEDYDYGRAGASNMRLNSNTKIIDTMGTKIKDTVILVCLGDSRGFVHMNHLILK